MSHVTWNRMRSGALVYKRHTKGVNSLDEVYAPCIYSYTNWATVRDSGLCCCVACLSSAINSRGVLIISLVKRHYSELSQNKNERTNKTAVFILCELWLARDGSVWFSLTPFPTRNSRTDPQKFAFVSTTVQILLQTRAIASLEQPALSSCCWEPSHAH